jgi:hypothetical protein
LASSQKKEERAAKLRVDADALDEEAFDLLVASWALDPSTDPRPQAIAAMRKRLGRKENDEDVNISLPPSSI